MTGQRWGYTMAGVALGLLLVMGASVPVAAQDEETPEQFPPVESPAGCIDFEEPPFALGTQYGGSFGNVPLDEIAMDHDVRVLVDDFAWVPSGGTFGDANVDPLPVFQGQSLHTNNINLVFDFSELPSTPLAVWFDFRDLGGFENVSVNGSPYTAFELESMTFPDVRLDVYREPSSTRGLGRVSGPVKQLGIGGQEFWIDHVCWCEAQ